MSDLIDTCRSVIGKSAPPPTAEEACREAIRQHVRELAAEPPVSGVLSLSQLRERLGIDVSAWPTIKAAFVRFRAAAKVDQLWTLNALTEQILDAPLTPNPPAAPPQGAPPPTPRLALSNSVAFETAIEAKYGKSPSGHYYGGAIKPAIIADLDTVHLMAHAMVPMQHIPPFMAERRGLTFDASGDTNEIMLEALEALGKIYLGWLTLHSAIGLGNINALEMDAGVRVRPQYDLLYEWERDVGWGATLGAKADILPWLQLSAKARYTFYNHAMLNALAEDDMVSEAGGQLVEFIGGAQAWLGSWGTIFAQTHLRYGIDDGTLRTGVHAGVRAALYGNLPDDGEPLLSHSMVLEARYRYYWDDAMTYQSVNAILAMRRSWLSLMVITAWGNQSVVEQIFENTTPGVDASAKGCTTEDACAGTEAARSVTTEQKVFELVARMEGEFDVGPVMLTVGLGAGYAWPNGLENGAGPERDSASTPGWLGILDTTVKF
ncbi:MAG: hypothetical protein HY543_04525 [Deltaproteobacteria bacterium]|nr:hypothetical protein [Deltaproteobacteria bacterium]